MGNFGQSRQSFEHLIACFRRSFCCNRNKMEFYGIILLIVGAVTIGAFFLPVKVWLIVVSLIMIYAGYKLFIS